MRLMWPLFILCAVLDTFAEQFAPKSGIIGGQLVLFTMMLYITHDVILSGQSNFWRFSGFSNKQRPISLRFVGLVFAVMGLPMIAGAVLGVLTQRALGSDAFLTPLAIIAVSLWISLTFFGTSMPRHVWGELIENDEANSPKGRPMWRYIGPRLLLWNLAYLILILLLLVALHRFNLSAVGASIPFLDIGIGIVVKTFSYIAMTLTAAVLSHAYIRSYDLGPQGLIDQP